MFCCNPLCSKMSQDDRRPKCTDCNNSQTVDPPNVFDTNDPALVKEQVMKLVALLPLTDLQEVTRKCQTLVDTEVANCMF